jgi:hypothetical protein
MHSNDTNQVEGTFDAGQLTPAKRSGGRRRDRPARVQEAIHAEPGF